MENVDRQVVNDFGDEWARFDQAGVSRSELQQLFEEYFSLFPWDSLPDNPQGFDLGCGSGRWAQFVAPKVGRLHCIDPAQAALETARRNLRAQPNCEFHCASVDAIPLPEASMDFGYSLGVLHHVPDTAKGLQDCVTKLRPGAPFLVYLYYAFDNRPAWFKALWKVSDYLRRGICLLPPRAKVIVTDAIALLVYLPLVRTASVLQKAGANVESFPLSSYRGKSFYTLRTDARDRFGTRLEQRFTRREIEQMMLAAGLERIAFRDEVPYWCALGYKAC